MARSDKIITTTTQLISEDKIKRLMWKIQPKFQIANYDGIATRLAIKDGRIKMDIWWAAVLDIGAPSFTLMTGTQYKFNTVLSKGKWA